MSETILIIDDDPQVANVIHAVLKKQGYTTIVTLNGLTALSQLMQHGRKINLVILDMVMPVMSGDEVCKKILEMYPTMKILITSGYTQEEALENFKEKVNFIQKPFTSTGLTEKVKSVLSSAG